MQNDTLILGLLAVAALVLTAGTAYGMIQQTDNVGNPLVDSDGNPIMIPISDVSLTQTVNDDTDANANARIQAFLAMIRQFESKNDYYIIYGGAHFTDDSKHPFDGKPLPAHSAAGAYQFILKTWKGLQNQYQLPDFSPASQDTAALGLLINIGALDAINADNIDQALRIASKQWASLPYSTANQNPQSLQTALATYSSFLNA